MVKCKDTLENFHMDLQDAIQKIEERGDFNRFIEVKPIFEQRLGELKPNDHAERGLCYYYLLVAYLKGKLVHETEECMHFYRKMGKAFSLQEREYLKGSQKYAWSEVVDFYRLMERCYGSLEFLYLQHDFSERHLEAYRRKMTYRKDAAFFKRHYLRFFEYKFLEVTAFYGTSIWRWSLTTLAFSVIIAFAHMLADLTLPVELRTVQNPSAWFDYFYLSIITITTVGFGDITPVSTIGKILTMTEAFLGFVMLSIFVSLITKKP